MDAVLKVVGTIGAIWLTVSILAAIFWGLAGRKIFRRPPAPPRLVRRDGTPITDQEIAAVREIAKLDHDLRGGA